MGKKISSSCVETSQELIPVQPCPGDKRASFLKNNSHSNAPSDFKLENDELVCGGSNVEIENAEKAIDETDERLSNSDASAQTSPGSNLKPVKVQRRPSHKELERRKRVETMRCRYQAPSGSEAEDLEENKNRAKTVVLFTPCDEIEVSSNEALLADESAVLQSKDNEDNGYEIISIRTWRNSERVGRR